MENILEISYYLTTDLMVKFIIAIVFPALVIGIAIKKMRNMDRN